MKELSRELSIIIPVFNHWKLTAKCLASIFKSSYPKEKYEIILVNNASTDKTDTFISYLVEQGEPINYIKLEENLNFCKGINRGWKEVKTPFLMLLNNDAFVTKTCIEKMMKVITSAENIGIVGAMEYLMGGVPSKEKPFIYFDKEKLLDPILMGYDEVTILDDDNVDVDIVGSACCIIRKEVSDEIGFFDERFSPAMFEQEDFWLRTKLAGFRIVMVPTAKFFHMVGATTAFDNPYYQKVIKENKKKFLKKWKNRKDWIGGLK